MPGKMNVPIRPQAHWVIVSDGVERVIGPAMGIAAAARQSGQLAKHGDCDGGAQGRLELGHGDDFSVVEQAHNLLGRKANNIHNVILTPDSTLSSVIITF